MTVTIKPDNQQNCEDIARPDKGAITAHRKKRTHEALLAVADFFISFKNRTIRIKTMVIKKAWKPTNIVNKGHNIEASIDTPPERKRLAGWCRVFHQSTENLTIGRLIAPTRANIAAGRAPRLRFSNPPAKAI